MLSTEWRGGGRGIKVELGYAGASLSCIILHCLYLGESNACCISFVLTVTGGSSGVKPIIMHVAMYELPYAL